MNGGFPVEIHENHIDQKGASRAREFRPDRSSTRGRGEANPGSMPPDAKSLTDEGVIIPPVHLLCPAW